MVGAAASGTSSEELEAAQDLTSLWMKKTNELHQQVLNHHHQQQQYRNQHQQGSVFGPPGSGSGGGGAPPGGNNPMSNTLYGSLLLSQLHQGEARSQQQQQQQQQQGSKTTGANTKAPKTTTSTSNNNNNSNKTSKKDVNASLGSLDKLKKKSDNTANFNSMLISAAGPSSSSSSTSPTSTTATTTLGLDTTTLQAMPQLSKSKPASSTTKERRASAMSALSQASDATAMSEDPVSATAALKAKRRSREKSSNFRGVSRCAKDGRWQSRIRVGKSVKYLGRFLTEVDAARCYDNAARQYHGNRAVLNFIDGQQPAAQQQQKASAAQQATPQNLIVTPRRTQAQGSKFEDLEYESKLTDDSLKKNANANANASLSTMGAVEALGNAENGTPPKKKQRRATTLARGPAPVVSGAKAMRRNSLPPSIATAPINADVYSSIIAQLGLVGRVNAARDASASANANSKPNNRSGIPTVQDFHQQLQQQPNLTEQQRQQHSLLRWQSLLSNDSSQHLQGLTAGMLAGMTTLGSNNFSAQKQFQNQPQLQQQPLLSPVSRELAAKKVSKDMSGAISGLISLNSGSGSL